MSVNNLEHYQVCISWSEEDEAFVASMPELPGCVADGQTQPEALTNLHEVAELWIETAQQLGRAIPAPRTGSAIPASSELPAERSQAPV